MIGTSLGPYKIIEQLGAGGMGEVYRARDTKLERDVAIKVLPDDLAADPDRLARFEREARLLASLNHSNIGAIHGLEESDGVRFLVLELIEGETLEQRLRKGPIPVPEALDIARQIAEALEAAHDEGIIHRDVKPANVLLTGRGGVKVLDFGIAKNTVLDGTAAAGAALTEQATSLTIDGTLMGTPPYMAPEQIRGEEADKRADIWAFGCVLYEMLAGRGAFVRETVADTLAAVLDAEPEWGALPGDTPPAVRSVLARCLRKKVDRRMRDIGDARIEIEEPLVQLPGLTTEVERWRSGVPAIHWAVLLVAVLVTVAAVSFAMWSVVGAAGTPEYSVAEFALPRGARMGGRTPAFALSPDGSKLVYQAVGVGMRVRRLDGLTDTLVSDRGHTPFFSPDGEWVAYVASDGNGKDAIWKVRSTGGAPRRVAYVGRLRGAAWGPDDSIVFGEAQGGLFRVSAGGGDEPEPLTSLATESGEISHRSPAFLPGGEAIVFSVLTGFRSEDFRIELLRLDDLSRQIVVERGTDPRFVATGHLLFGRVPSLMAIAFDESLLETSGAAVVVVDEIRFEPDRQIAFYDVSENGKLVYELPLPLVPTDQEVVLVDRNGVAEPVGIPLGPYSAPRISHDGSRIALNRTEGREVQVVIWEAGRGQLLPFATEGTYNSSAVWAPTDDALAFSSMQQGVPGLYRQPFPSGAPALLVEPGRGVGPEDWSADGKFLLYRAVDSANAWNIWMRSADNGTRGPSDQHLVRGDDARFSRDGKWIVYRQNVNGSNEIFVASIADPSQRRQVASGGADIPRWSRDGTELFYRDRSGDPRSIMVVSISTEPELELGRPRKLFEAGDMLYLEPMPDGEHFVMIRPTSAPARRDRLVLALNWFEELKRLMRTGR